MAGGKMTWSVGARLPSKPHERSLRRIVVFAALIFCPSCTVTEPVVAVGPNGDIFHGTTTAALNGGTFGVSDGKITCSGTYDDYDLSPTLTIPTKCSDGRTGIITATREAGAHSGMGTIAVSDGTTWSFGFGADAARVEQNANSHPVAASDNGTSASVAAQNLPSDGPEGGNTVVERASPPTLGQSVSMKKEGGTYAVPVKINDSFTLDFVVDSGSADVSVPADVVLTLMRMNTIGQSDFLGNKTYQLADGSTLPSPTFRIRSLKVGGKVIENVIGNVANVESSPLLGQSFLERFKSWKIDNKHHALVLEGGE
jgi:predicted aspartyl protease